MKTLSTAIYFVIAVAILSFLSLDVDPDRANAVHSVPFRAISYNGAIYGSGSYIQYKGKYFILTNRHVCAAGTQITGNKKQIQVDKHIAKIVAISKRADLCLVESDRKAGLEIAEQAAQPLDKITLIGYPRGVGLVIRTGRIIGDERITINYPYGQLTLLATRISATAYPGNSGSPVLKDGKVVGVLFAGHPSFPHEPFIVPHSFLVEFLDKVVGKK
jgi:S1-C subfamily serine protease